MMASRFAFSVNRFPPVRSKLAEYKTLFFFKEKQGLSKVYHRISHLAGIILKFN
jgi:hypothetical protein